MSKRTLFSVCGDPGGANALVPVIRLLETEGRFKLRNFAYHEGEKVLQRHGLQVEFLPLQPTPGVTRSYFLESLPSALITATSHNQIDWEKYFIASSRQLEVPSVAVIDFWSNYTERFSDATGELQCLPDAVAVMDERASTEMVQRGIPRERIVVTGQPAFDSLGEYRLGYQPERKESFRRQLKVRDGEKLIVFVSQPLRRLYGGPEAETYLGFDELTVLPRFVSALEKLTGDLRRGITLLVRPHPRESIEAYRWCESSSVPVIVSGEGDAREVLMACDLVVGMNTNLLTEATLLGCLVLSLQPGLRVSDMLDISRWGSGIVIYDEMLIESTLHDLLVDGWRKSSATSVNVFPPEKAARNVADLLYSLCRN